MPKIGDRVKLIDRAMPIHCACPVPLVDRLMNQWTTIREFRAENRIYVEGGECFWWPLESFDIDYKFQEHKKRMLGV